MAMTTEDINKLLDGQVFELDTTGRYNTSQLYSDNIAYYIDDHKNITKLNDLQINLQSETYSQYITFVMPRHYDKIDFKTMILYVHYLGADEDGTGKSNYVVKPINVQYSEDYVKFSWLVGYGATKTPGDVKFEIQAIGTVTIGDSESNYVWKSQPNGILKITKALDASKQPTEIDGEKYEDWFAEYSNLINVKAKEISDNAKAVEDTKKYVENLYQNLYTKEEVQQKIDSIKGLDELITKYNSETNSIEFYDNSKTTDNTDDDILLQTINLDQAARFDVSLAKNDNGQDVLSFATKDGTTFASIALVVDPSSTWWDEASAKLKSEITSEVNTKLATVNETTTKMQASIDNNMKGIQINMNDLTRIKNEGTKVKTFIVDSYDKLPTEDIVPGAMYLVKRENDTNGHLYDFYNYVIKDGEGSWQKISSDDTDLSDYYTKEEVDESLKNVKVDLTDYYTKEQTDSAIKTSVDAAQQTFSNSISELQNTVSTHSTNISDMSTQLSQINQRLEGFDGSSGRYYRAKYTHHEPDEQNSEEYYLFELVEYKNADDAINDEDGTPVSSFQLAGGSGGTSSTSTITITRDEKNSPAQYTVLTGESVVLRFNYNSVDSSGQQTDESTATIEVDGNVVIRNYNLIYGDNAIDVTQYITVGTHRVTITCTDSQNTRGSKRWTVRCVEIGLTSDFNDKLARQPGNVILSYVPSGAVEKTVHFVQVGEDGSENEIGTVTTSNSGTTEYYTIPNLTYGSYLIKMWITATINGADKSTKDNAIYKDIVIYDSDSPSTVIGTAQQYITMKQYSTVNIGYVVQDPHTSTPTVVFKDGDTVVRTEIMTSSTGTWSYKASDIGDRTLTINVTDTVNGEATTVTKTIHVTVTDLGIQFKKVNADAVFDFNPVGKSNSSEEDRNWTYQFKNDQTGAVGTKVTMSVSDNFDYNNGGYQIDPTTGDSYFCVKAGTRAYLDYDMFNRNTEIKTDGLDFKVIFRTANVMKANTTILKCYDDTEVAGKKVGVEMLAHGVYFRSSGTEAYMGYSENDVIELNIDLQASSNASPLMLIYEDGVASAAEIVASSDSFQHRNVKTPIEIGSDDCDVWIYRMRYYPVSISDEDVITDFITDARTAEEMVDRYTRNQIFDENGNLTPESVAEACPDLRIILLDTPYFTNSKKDYVKDTNVQCIYKNGDPIEDNWYWQNCYHSGQGTSSNRYGAAGRNIDIICCADGEHQIIKKIPLAQGYASRLFKGYGTYGKYGEGLEEGSTYYLNGGSPIEGGQGKVTLTRTSVPLNWANIKVRPNGLAPIRSNVYSVVQ